MKEPMNEKNSFILYASYEEQLNMLNDAQVGQLLRGIYTYARTGEQHSDDPMVALMLSVVCRQMDLDASRYEDKIERRREAGRKGGLQTAENKAKTKKSSKSSNAKNASKTAKMDGLQSSDEIVSECAVKQSAANAAVDDDVDVDEDVDVDVDVVNKYRGDGDDVGAEEEEYAHAPVPQLIYYTDNGYPTIQAEVDKCSAFTDKLFRSYWNRKPSKYDMAQVFDYVSGYAQLPDGTGYAVFDAEKADLLEYVFKLAANSDSTKWKYVDGVYKRFRERGIHNLYDAQLYDWELEHGKGVLV